MSTNHLSGVDYTVSSAIASDVSSIGTYNLRSSTNKSVGSPTSFSVLTTSTSTQSLTEEEEDKCSDNVIIELKELKNQVNKEMFCRKCAEKHFDKKCNNLLVFAKAEEEALYRKALSMPFRIPEERDSWIASNRKGSEETLQCYKKHCANANLGWLDDCQSKPMNKVEVHLLSGIASRLVSKCACGHTMSIEPKEVIPHNGELSDTKKEQTNIGGTSNKPSVIYELNNQLVTGVQSCGGGGTQAEAIMASLSIPHGCHLRQNFSIYEENIGRIERDISDNLQMEALEREKVMTVEKENTKCRAYDGKILLTVSYDMGWSKRSSGNKYDSNSGHAHVIGYYTRQVIATKVFCKTCIVCDEAEKKI